jgi:glucosylceramidase
VVSSLHLAFAVGVGLAAGACGGEGPASEDARDGSPAGGDAGPGGPILVSVWQTDATQNLAPQPPIAFAADAPSSLRTIDVDDTITYQTIDGFGAAMTDSSAWLIETRMSADQRSALMTNLFDPVAGAGLSLLRVPMGASDFHVGGSNATNFCTGGEPYSYDDDPPGGADPTLAHFSIDHDLPYIIPALQQALALNPELKIMASPWSPPAWMKSNGLMTNCGNSGHFLAQYSAALASYFVKFIQAYQAHGIPIHAITPQNEPGQQTNYPGMNWTAAEETAFIGQHLGPALAAARLAPTILAFDYNASADGFARPVLADPTAAHFTGGIAYHCYGGVDAGVAAAALHRAHPDKQIFGTECTSSTTSVKPASDIIIDMTRGFARGVLMWNLALDPDGGPRTGTGCNDCTGTVTIDPATGDVTYNRQYYELAHAARFVVPGARRVDSNAIDFVPGMAAQNVAFINPDGTRVLLVHNRSPSPADFRVRWNLTQSFIYSLPPDAVATFTWTGTPTPVTAPIRIHAGGAAAGSFDIDSHHDDAAGATFTTSAAIDTTAVTDPAPDVVYQTERYGELTYSIHPLPPDRPVTVRLHFAEVYVDAPGQRLFDVTINGTPVLHDFDILAAAGGKNRAVVVDSPAAPDARGILTLSFTRGSAQNPKLNGIEILPE